MDLGDATTVYVTQSSGTERTVYHTGTDCPVPPGAYTSMERSLAMERGLRECNRCRDRRYDVLEL
ncbi:MAG: hypothetical protein ABEJ44_03175 [Halanaeroarchaeum sp.]